jgi:hypothetical protein
MTRLLALIGLLGIPVQAADLCPLAEALNKVVASETAYALPPCPRIGFSTLPEGGTAVHSQAGAFLPESGRIELAPDLDLTSAYGQSYLLHELVHAAQYANGAQTRAPCPAALEAEAYGVQAHFLREHGLGQEALVVSLLADQLGNCGQAADY